MNRSKINSEIKWAKSLLETCMIKLPPFGYWDMDKWNEKLDSTLAIRSTMLGWDVTDFGGGDFDSFGAVLFTLRNGKQGDELIGTPYAEKLIVLKDGQRLPLHYHASKTEDIINRGLGVLCVKLYNSHKDGSVDYDSMVTVDLDGARTIVGPGEEVDILPGSSITLRPFMYHTFKAKKGSGELICGEVSTINDDNTDNYNAEPVSRFTSVVEDEGIMHPLCNEYEKLFGKE